MGTLKPAFVFLVTLSSSLCSKFHFYSLFLIWRQRDHGLQLVYVKTKHGPRIETLWITERMSDSSNIENTILSFLNGLLPRF